ncbi:tail fiber domain-containing protein [Tenacibaculum sp. UWU-22]|uniref:tail fiber domain-containing protein n=1 Tax=Tenacibaculum sp. UWU-22 TaxID=3234187 RepID=UPI0034DAE840
MNTLINNQKLLFTILALMLAFASINAQEVNIIDNKGTIRTVNNNTVTTSTDGSAPSNPLEADVWFDVQNNEIKFYDTVDGWKPISFTAWSTTGNLGTTAGTNFIGTKDAVDFVTKTNNTEVMRVTKDGNVGIGTTTPLSKLHVKSTDGSKLLTLAGPASSGELIFKDLASGSYPSGLSSLLTTTDGFQIDLPQSSNLIFKIRNNDPTDGFHIVNNTNDQIFTANAGGRIGIGVANPSEKLQLHKGQFYITRPSDTDMIRFQIGADGFAYGNRTNDYGIAFESNSSGAPGRVARISAGDAHPTNATGVKYLGFQVGTATLISDTKLLYLTSANGGRVGIKSETPSYTLYVNGTAGGTSAYVNTSDARLKTDVTPLKNALDKVMQLQGVTFNWDKNRTVGKKLDLDNKNHIGFIAQQIEKVLPQVVNTDTSKEKIKSVAYSDVVPVLVEAIKAQQKIINQLKKDNEALKAVAGNVSRLENEIKQINRFLELKEDVSLKKSN